MVGELETWWDSVLQPLGDVAREDLRGKREDQDENKAFLACAEKRQTSMSATGESKSVKSSAEQAKTSLPISDSSDCESEVSITTKL